MEDRSIIYKYRSWGEPNHRKVLLENQFYFSSPADINDPFDCQLSPDLSLLDTEEKKDLFIQELLADAKNILKDRKINHHDRAKVLRKRLEIDLANMQQEYDRLHSTYTNARFGVISFSFRWDSILMWSHYSDNHKGFCVGLDRKLVEQSNFFDSAGPVNYQDDFPKVDPNNSTTNEAILSKTHCKATDWAYEEEYRLVKLWVDNNPSQVDRQVVIPNNFFREIILGKNISAEHRNEIRKYADSKKIPVFQIVARARAFLLDKVQL